MLAALKRIPWLGDRAPDATRTAVVAADRSWTYAELDQRVAAIAKRLQGMGVGRGARVGVQMHRSFDMIAALLACHSVGAAYVPLDPSYPVARLNDIVAMSDLAGLIHDGRIFVSEPPPVLVDLSRQDADCILESVNYTSAGYKDLAYAMFTSGSTGRPKGVRIHFGALAHFLAAMRREPGIAPDDVMLAQTTIAFDISILELFLPLTVGASIVLATREQAIDGAALAQIIDSRGITIAQATPATWRIILGSGWRGCLKLKALCGGEALDDALASALLPRVGELWNMYGPTETTVWSACGRILDHSEPVSVGWPIGDTTLHVLDEDYRPVPPGSQGELYIGGPGVALGYMEDSQTREQFIDDPNSPGIGSKLYRTGDLARFAPNGALIVSGRIDHQVKIRGFRVELGEIENHLGRLCPKAMPAVVAVPSPLGESRLVAFIATGVTAEVDSHALRRALSESLPTYMVPSAINILHSLPLTPNGKIDRKALAASVAKVLPQQADCDEGADPAAALKSILTHIVGGVVSGHERFVDLGIDSIQANYIAATLRQRFGLKISVADLFDDATLDDIALSWTSDEGGHRASDVVARVNRRARRIPPSHVDQSIAVIGMAGRFPGANNLDELWTVLSSGAETVTRFDSDRDDPSVEDETRNHPGYVRARGMVERPEMFDAAFFGIPPLDASVMDPQLRVFLELAWHALEDAGCDPDRFDGQIGVYAGMGNNLYYRFNVSTRPDLIRMVGEVQAEIGREKDHIATLLSHKLNLTGPSLSVHTACSTGLVAIDCAVHSLLGHQCDVALAGAIELRTPQMAGQIHEPGGIFTADGHCRPFSAHATGTMFSDGAGIVVVKRLDDARRDGDRIRAVIRGSAVNHDGSAKRSYLAPSARAQMEVIALAQARAGLSPREISYIEAHGTATPVGDPIEFEALRGVFEVAGTDKQYCALGSVKANLGHPTTAAGVVSVIKVCLALEHREIPPMINLEEINENINLESSPFFINTRPLRWDGRGSPRRAGVSSFGFCGTNAHVVLEEAPHTPDMGGTPRAVETLLLSAASAPALDVLTAAHLAEDAVSRQSPGSAAYTLATGRKRLRHRRFLLVRGNRDRIPELLPQSGDPSRELPTDWKPKLVFAFPGQGTQYLGMGRGLYDSEPSFRVAYDECADAVTRYMRIDLGQLVMGTGTVTSTAAERAAQLDRTAYTQPAIFCLEYAMARLWLAWGLRPDALVGHSIGEFACGVIAGVMSLEDAARLVVSRGRVMESMPDGGMLAVRQSAADLRHELGATLSIAAVNSPRSTVIAGPRGDLERLAARLEAKGVGCRALRTSHAFHSWMMEPAVSPFRDEVAACQLRPPHIPIISTFTGIELTPNEAVSSDYWGQQLTATVRFSDAFEHIAARTRDVVLLECGPGSTLSSFAASQTAPSGRLRAIPTSDTAFDSEIECTALATAVGRLWQSGIELDWPAYFTGRPHAKIALPAYPFERKRHWVNPAFRRGDDSVSYPSIEESETPDATACDTVDGTLAADDIGIRVRAIFSKVSGKDCSAAPGSASLFELGFDSLMLTPLSYLLKDRFGLVVTFRKLMTDLSTIDALVAQVAQGVGVARMPEFAAENDDDAASRPSVPITARQWAMLHSSQSVISAVIDVPAVLDPDAVHATILTIAAQHEALRLRFTTGSTSAVILEPEASGITLEIIGANAADMEEVERAFSLQPFDLVTGPPIRIAMVSETCHTTLLIAAHAAVCDGWSMDVLIEKIASAQSGAADGSGPTPSRADSWTAFAARHATDAVSEGLSARRADHVEPAHIRRYLPDDVSSAMRLYCREERTSLYSAMLAAVALTAPGIAIAHGRLAIVLAGQAAENKPALVGQCANVVPFTLPSGSGGTIASVLPAVRESLIAAHESQWTAQVPAGTEICFSHTKRLPDSALCFGGSTANYRLYDRSRSFPVVLDAHDDDVSMLLHCTYAPLRLTASEVNNWLDRIVALLASVRPETLASPALAGGRQ